MKWILEKLSYGVDDTIKARHKIVNGIDIFLVFTYLAVSLYNTFTGVNSLEFWDSTGKFYPSNATIRTVITISINIIVAIRLYIRSWIQWKDDSEYATSILNKNEQYDKVVIEALEARMRFAKYVVIVAFVLLFVLLFLGSAATPLVAVFIAVITLLSCANNVIDILVKMYSAKPKPSKLIYFEWR